MADFHDDIDMFASAMQDRKGSTNSHACVEYEDDDWQASIPCPDGDALSVWTPSKIQATFASVMAQAPPTMTDVAAPPAAAMVASSMSQSMGPMTLPPLASSVGTAGRNASKREANSLLSDIDTGVFVERGVIRNELSRNDTQCPIVARVLLFDSTTHTEYNVQGRFNGLDSQLLDYSGHVIQRQSFTYIQAHPKKMHAVTAAAMIQVIGQRVLAAHTGDPERVSSDVATWTTEATAAIDWKKVTEACAFDILWWLVSQHRRGRMWATTILDSEGAKLFWIHHLCPEILLFRAYDTVCGLNFSQLLDLKQQYFEGWTNQFLQRTWVSTTYDSPYHRMQPIRNRQLLASDACDEERMQPDASHARTTIRTHSAFALPMVTLEHLENLYKHVEALEGAHTIRLKPSETKSFHVTLHVLMQHCPLETFLHMAYLELFQLCLDGSTMMPVPLVDVSAASAASSSSLPHMRRLKKSVLRLDELFLRSLERIVSVLITPNCKTRFASIKFLYHFIYWNHPNYRMDFGNAGPDSAELDWPMEQQMQCVVELVRQRRLVVFSNESANMAYIVTRDALEHALFYRHELVQFVARAETLQETHESVIQFYDPDSQEYQKLNPNQKNVFAKMQERKHFLFLVLGPGGTGKTQTAQNCYLVEPVQNQEPTDLAAFRQNHRPRLLQPVSARTQQPWQWFSGGNGANHVARPHVEQPAALPSLMDEFDWDDIDEWRSRPPTPGRSTGRSPGRSRPPTPGRSRPPTPGRSRPPTPGRSRPPTPLGQVHETASSQTAEIHSTIVAHASTAAASSATDMSDVAMPALEGEQVEAPYNPWLRTNGVSSDVALGSEGVGAPSAPAPSSSGSEGAGAPSLCVASGKECITFLVPMLSQRADASRRLGVKTQTYAHVATKVPHGLGKTLCKTRALFEDEISMQSNSQSIGLLRGMRQMENLVVNVKMGDPLQLPPVESGNLLQDLYNMKIAYDRRQAARAKRVAKGTLFASDLLPPKSRDECIRTDDINYLCARVHLEELTINHRVDADSVSLLPYLDMIRYRKCDELLQLLRGGPAAPRGGAAAPRGGPAAPLTPPVFSHYSFGGHVPPPLLSSSFQGASGGVGCAAPLLPGVGGAPLQGAHPPFTCVPLEHPEGGFSDNGRLYTGEHRTLMEIFDEYKAAPHTYQILVSSNPCRNYINAFLGHYAGYKMSLRGQFETMAWGKPTFGASKYESDLIVRGSLRVQSNMKILFQSDFTIDTQTMHANTIFIVRKVIRLSYWRIQDAARRVRDRLFRQQFPGQTPRAYQPLFNDELYVYIPHLTWAELQQCIPDDVSPNQGHQADYFACALLQNQSSVGGKNGPSIVDTDVASPETFWCVRCTESFYKHIHLALACTTHYMQGLQTDHVKWILERAQERHLNQKVAITATGRARKTVTVYAQNARSVDDARVKLVEVVGVPAPERFTVLGEILQDKWQISFDTMDALLR